MRPTKQRAVDRNGSILELWLGDITRFGPDVQAIADAANSSLLGGGGVDGAIHHAAGPRLLQESRALGGCPTGDARITGAGRLPQRHVIHCVGPIYSHHQPEESARLLQSAYRAGLALATERRLTSLAFPSISTGIYGYPLDEAAPLVVDVLLAHLHSGHPPRQVMLVLYDERTLAAYDAALRRLAPADG
jgi:O-acetyl-ADP-ribose deacetylase (regulator of RNase III)